jgi:hypothetical protein
MLLDGFVSRRSTGRRLTRSAFLCMLAVGGLLPGCGPPKSAALSSNIGDITGHFIRYASANGNKAPPDEAAFRKFMEGIKVADIDRVLVSSRDGKPWVVKYGVKLDGDPTKASLPPADQPKIVILHEAEGVAGKKLTATHAGLTFEVADPDSVK